jgi:hypothetical protein
MEQTYEQALKDMAHARKHLADYVRATLKLDAVDLFAQAESPDDQKR